MGLKMANKFQKLGNIRGKPIAEIVGKVGKPNSVSAMTDGQLYQWIKTGIFGGYHYSISVDADGNAIGYTHQFVK